MISFYYFFRILCSANPSNVTFSDDDEQFVECQSFNDLSHKIASANTTIVSESAPLNDSGLNKTVSEEAENKNATFTNQANVTQNLGETFSGGANETFNAIAESIGEKHDSQDRFTSFTVTAPSQADEERKVSTDEEVPKAAMSEVPEPVAAQKAEFIVDNISSQPEKPFETEDATVFPPAEQDLEQQVHPFEDEDVEMADAEQYFGDTAADAGEFIKQEKLCLLEQEAIALPQEEVAVTPEQEAVFALPEIVAEDVEAPMEISYRNIDEGSRSLSSSMVNSTTNVVSSPVSSLPPANEVVPKTEEFKAPMSVKADNVFVDKMESSFDVQFKTPFVPVFKPQNSSGDFGDDEFKTCGSSCKLISFPRRKTLRFPWENVKCSHAYMRAPPSSVSRACRCVCGLCCCHRARRKKKFLRHFLE